MAVNKLEKKDDKKEVLKDEHKIAILNSLYFLDEIVVGVVLDRVVDEEQKISPEDYSKILFSTTTLSEINGQSKAEIEKIIEGRAEEVRKGVNDFNLEYTLSLKNKDNKDDIGIFKVKKVISFIDDNRVVVSFDLSDSNNDLSDSNNNEVYKIIFDELRNEYKKLETLDIDKLSKYIAEGIVAMYTRAAAANPNNVN